MRGARPAALGAFVIVVLLTSAYEPPEPPSTGRAQTISIDGLDRVERSKDVPEPAFVQTLARQIVPQPLAKTIVEHMVWESSMAVMAIVAGWVGLRRREGFRRGQEGGHSDEET